MNKKKKKFLSLWEGYYNWRSIKILYSICKCLTKESFWEDNTFQFRKTLLGISCPKSPIYRPLMAIQKSLEQMWLLGVIFWRVVTLGSYFLKSCDSWELFSKELWLLVVIWRVVTLGIYFLKSCDSWELFSEELWLLGVIWRVVTLWSYFLKSYDSWKLFSEELWLLGVIF